LYVGDVIIAGHLVPCERQVRPTLESLVRQAVTVLLNLMIVAGASVLAAGQCPVSVFTEGLHAPAKIISSTKNNLLVTEGGNGPNTSRISITTRRRRFIVGLLLRWKFSACLLTRPVDPEFVISGETFTHFTGDASSSKLQ
jgi:hypothetical protein